MRTKADSRDGARNRGKTTVGARALRSGGTDGRHRAGPGKPFAIAETAWPAEDVTAPYPITIRSNADYQRRYVEFLLSSADALSGKFADPNAALIRLWRDTGLYDGAGAPRPGLTTWRSVLSRPVR